jgi:DNA-directed RNA polymerase subunit RPC12/RpoP
MDDQWSERLRCPKCSETGMVSLTLPERAEIPKVNDIAAGFKVVQTQHGPSFRCENCDVEVDP